MYYLAFSGNYDALKLAIKEYDCDPNNSRGGPSIWSYLESSYNNIAIEQSKIDFPRRYKP